MKTNFDHPLPEEPDPLVIGQPIFDITEEEFIELSTKMAENMGQSDSIGPFTEEQLKQIDEFLDKHKDLMDDLVKAGD